MAGGSASRKRLTRNNNIPSSVHKVLSNDDLLMEILLRLPILSLHLFTLVSKQWRSLIKSPTFTSTRTQIAPADPSSGIFIRRYSLNSIDVHMEFVSFDPRIPAKRSILFTHHLEAAIVQSCNGLLLCCISSGKYCIYNPLISMFKILPPIHDLNYKKSHLNCMSMAFDPAKSPCYKVVYVGELHDEDHELGYSIRIQTYSSESGVWSVWDDRFSLTNFNHFFFGVYWNGAICWLNNGQRFFVKLDIADRPVLTTIQIPLTAKGVHCHRKLFTSHGSLLLLCKDYAYSRHLNIYEMKNGYSEWSAKYFVNVDDMMRQFPTWRMPPEWGCWDILSIVLGEREEDRN